MRLFKSDDVNYVNLLFCVVRQVVCAAAGCVGAQRGDRCDSGQQPTEWCSYIGLSVLDLPVARPARNAGCFDLHTDSHYYGARQVMLCESTTFVSGLSCTCVMNLICH